MLAWVRDTLQCEAVSDAYSQNDLPPITSKENIRNEAKTTNIQKNLPQKEMQ